MTDFDLTKYEPKDRVVWDSVVKKSKSGNFLHLRDYMGYHAHRFDDQSIIIRKRDTPVAIFPCNKADGIIVSHGGLTYGGLIYGSELHAANVMEIFGLLVDYYRNIGAKAIHYKAIPHIFHRYPAEEDLYALYRCKAKLVRRDLSSVIFLDNKLTLSDSRKSTIRKAEKFGVKVAESCSMSEFHELLAKVLEKFRTKPVHSLYELELLQSRFPQSIRLFGAFKDEQIMAGALVYDFGTVAHTQYLASSEIGREIGALDLVIAHLICSVFVGRRYFSFGISTEQEGNFLNEGLIFQKEGFGARGVAHDCYELEI